MKRILSIVLCAAMIMALPIMSYADVDLSGMSYDELVALKDQINLAMWECEEWQEVEVPQGVWQVGVDIPAGHWTITVASDSYASVSVGKELDESGKDVERSDYGWCMLTSPSMKSFDAKDDIQSTDFELVDGAYVIIENSNVIFTPYQGKPSLGFK